MDATDRRRAWRWLVLWLLVVVGLSVPVAWLMDQGQVLLGTLLFVIQLVLAWTLRPRRPAAGGNDPSPPG